MAVSIATHVAQSFSGLSGASASSFQSACERTGTSFVSVGNSRCRTKDLNSRLRPKFSEKLPFLQVKKPTSLPVSCAFTPSASIQELVQITTPSQTTPLHDLDVEYHAELIRKLGRVLKLPSPDRSDDGKRHPYADLRVADRWQEIQGAQDWEGLLEETMDPVLRGEIIRYGEFAQATYDAFDYDQHSKFCGSARFGKKKLLSEVGLENRGYEITDYLYATADSHLPKFFRKSDKDDKWSKDSNFMGFVAVCTSPREIARLGRRDIVVAWRGTVTKLEWFENIRDFFSPTGIDPRGKSEVMVESGFLSVYKSKNENSRYNKLSAREQVLTAVKKLVQQYKHEELSITVTGHSLGSALSMLSAYDIAESGINKRAHSPKVPKHWDTPSREELQHHSEKPCNNRVPVSVFSFAGPRLGNSAFRDRVKELGVNVLRVVNVHDQVPRVPGIIFNENLQFLHQFARWLPSSFCHVGTILELDSRDSDQLKPTTDPLHAHNMEAYLHLLDGFHGPDEPFSPALHRDVALVNKASDFLRSELGIPPYWWQPENKGLVKSDSGRWILPSRDPEDFPEAALAN